VELEFWRSHQGLHSRKETQRYMTSIPMVSSDRWPGRACLAESESQPDAQQPYTGIDPGDLKRKRGPDHEEPDSASKRASAETAAPPHRTGSTPRHWPSSIRPPAAVVIAGWQAARGLPTSGYLHKLPSTSRC